MNRIQRAVQSQKEPEVTKEFLEWAEDVQTHLSQEIRVTLSDKTIATFRPVVLEDVRAITASGITNEIEAAGRIIARNCVKWGDKPGITLPQLRSRDIEDIELISETLSPKEIPEFVELPDRSKSLTLLPKGDAKSDSGALASPRASGSGIEVIFRRPTYGDAEAISKNKNGGLEVQIAIALRLCIKWGDKDGVDEATLDSLNMGDWQGVAKVVDSFRPKPKDD
ncbi:hypothetical protein LC607_17975 [Nostoc sp. CHAB 5824]|nr:hypothetical protein [Nostoc sp. CHAB 5824]